MSFIGVAILSMGTTFLRGGLDPFTAVNTGISNKLGIGLGDFSFLFCGWTVSKSESVLS